MESPEVEFLSDSKSTESVIMGAYNSQIKPKYLCNLYLANSSQGRRTSDVTVKPFFLKLTIQSLLLFMLHQMKITVYTEYWSFKNYLKLYLKFVN